ncbi:MAG TPA: aquaporin family protein [Microbacterium sp.]|nr:MULTISPECIES: aquaporin [Microbacterium]MEC8762151.1 aquaporin [Actinomycetota bacterium]MBU20538.1 aquaporin family protein [Microbacterium sp.]MCC4267562.1 aquaporin [Microbacterium schleiferi]RCL87595.1 MAG: aquaporin family protein [Microbacterium sp.]HBS08083.1 aquaporin family protein [Microbacterium sp.]
MTLAPLARRAAAEFLGTGLLVTVVVGSGIMATRLTTDVGIQMLANSIATALGLSVLILMFGTISGAHFNPAVSLVDWFLGRRRRVGLTGPMLGIYTLAQIAGAIGGAVLANVMFDVPTSLSTTARATPATLIAEVVATFGLVLLIVALARTGRGAAAAPAVGAYIGAAYWFTSSTSFANPAVTIGRLFSDTFAGIGAPSVLPFIAAQLVGAAIAVVAAIALFPHVADAAEEIVIPHADVDPDASAVHRRDRTAP